MRKYQVSGSNKNFLYPREHKGGFKNSYSSVFTSKLSGILLGIYLPLTVKGFNF